MKSVLDGVHAVQTLVVYNVDVSGSIITQRHRATVDRFAYSIIAVPVTPQAYAVIVLCENYLSISQEVTTLSVLAMGEGLFSCCVC